MKTNNEITLDTKELFKILCCSNYKCNVQSWYNIQRNKQIYTQYKGQNISSLGELNLHCEVSSH